MVRTCPLRSNDFSQNKLKDKTEKMGNAMGVVDLAFNKKSTHLAVSCMDSVIKVIDLLNRNFLLRKTKPLPSLAM